MDLELFAWNLRFVLRGWRGRTKFQGVVNFFTTPMCATVVHISQIYHPNVAYSCPHVPQCGGTDVHMYPNVVAEVPTSITSPMWAQLNPNVLPTAPKSIFLAWSRSSLYQGDKIWWLSPPSSYHHNMTNLAAHPCVELPMLPLKLQTQSWKCHC